MAHSRLDDELSVAVIEFINTPPWLHRLNADPFGFPKDTSLGTLWRGVDISAVDEDGQTEFMRAVIAGGAKFLYAEMLAEFQTTDVNVQDNQGRTALHWACAATSPKKKFVALCLSVPDCQIGLLDNDGRTAFDIAMQAGNEKISALFYRSIFEMEETHPQEALLRVLTITAEPEPDRPVFPGAALFAPIEVGNSLLVKALLERGVDLAATNTNGDTALHLAVKVCNLEIATLLLEAGSDAAAKDREGRTAMQVAVENQQEDIVAIFEGHEVVLPAPRTDLESLNQIWKIPLIQAATVGDLDAVCELLKLGADVNAGENDRCALHLAAEHGHTEIVKTLLAYGAQIEATTPLFEYTPLHLAAEHGHTETIQVLLANGAYIEAVAPLIVPGPLYLPTDNIAVSVALWASRHGALSVQQQWNGLQQL